MSKKPIFDVFGAGECWHWHLVSTNGTVIATSATSYTRKRDCIRAIDAVLIAIFDADIQGVE